MWGCRRVLRFGEEEPPQGLVRPAVVTVATRRAAPGASSRADRKPPLLARGGVQASFSEPFGVCPDEAEGGSPAQEMEVARWSMRGARRIRGGSGAGRELPTDVERHSGGGGCCSSTQQPRARTCLKFSGRSLGPCTALQSRRCPLFRSSPCSR